jgi:urease accessory protein
MRTAVSESAFLSALQLTDTLFPSGGYSHSFGLESYVQEKIVSDRASFQKLVSSMVTFSIGPCDAVIIKLIYRDLAKGSLDDVIRVDRMLESMKVVKEFREGSRQMGHNLLRMAECLWEDKLIKEFADAMREGRCFGHSPVAFSLISRTAGLSLNEAILAYLYIFLSGLTAAALRLIPLGQKEGQKVIKELQPLLITVTDRALAAEREDLSSFTPALDIQGMRHERLYSRLFRS